MESMFGEIRDPSERVRALCSYACQVDVDMKIPAKRYFRSGLEMVRMANVYCSEGDLEKAFMLYSKFLTLFVEKLPKHPDYKAVLPKEKATNKKKILDVMPKAEAVKNKLRERYTAEEGKRQELEKLAAAELAKEQEAKKMQEEEDLKFALELQSEEEKQHYDEAQARLQQDQQEQLRILQEQERERLNEEERGNRDLGASVAGIAGVNIGSDVTPPLYQEGDIPPHPPPDYSSLGVFDKDKPSMPSRELKPSAPPAYGSDVTSLPPSIDRGSKPTHFTSTGGTTHNKYGLRTVIVPAEIIVTFLNLALPNTNQNKETGGILCGKLANDSFRITHLLIPKQTGTADSFETSKEEEVFMYQDEHDLLTLGWIHTHPSQTAFLSSVDLHNHFYYQQMMPEAVAIVCSPKYNETGYFMLTPDFGLNYIRNCTGQGFHKHPNDSELFEECPHISEDQTGKVTVADLRT